jgi:thymidylate kinase
MSPFWTLLGPDFAGKSTVLTRLRDEHGWQVVSHDSAFVGEHSLVTTLCRNWIDQALVWTGTRYTPELVLSVMHTVILHQRDELARLCANGGGPVVVDSYYVKQLAACSLHGVVHGPTFDHWRSFPRPAGVLYLDLPPQVAWERAGRGARATRYEHYGERVTHEGFTRFQTDLRATMLAEVADLPLTVLDGTEPQDAVLAKIVATVGSGAPPC